VLAPFRSLPLPSLLLALRAAAPLTAQVPDVSEATISALQAAMAQGRVTSVQLVDAYLARIAAYDQLGPELNAMVRLNPQARADAAALDQERRGGKVRGPLHGIPIVIKDNFDTADLPTTGGSLALAGFRPPVDAFVVRKLRQAGAVILGKSNMHELAAGITTVSSMGGQTRNPYDPRRCPGGSSGGTGAAIAAGFATVGWGSDTCGSIRIPSSVNSLFGLRPTQGLASRTGIIPLSHTQDIPGPLARTVTDLAIALDVTVGPDSADSATHVLLGRGVPRFTDSLSAGALKGARLGILTNYFRDADDEVADTVKAALAAMKSSGAEVIDVTIPDFDSLVAGSSVINFETKFDLMDYLARTPGAPVASLREIMDRGLYHSALETRLYRADTVQLRDGEPYRKALAKQTVVRERIVALLDSLKLDVLAYPTLRRKPVLIGDAQLGTNCQLSAQTGLPALAAPAGFTADGLPVGLELLGRPFSDAHLVSMAYAFEQSGPRRRAPPTTPPLVNGRAPRPVAFTAAVALPPGTARAHFRFDGLKGELDYDVGVAGLPPDRIQAVVLRRPEGDRPGRVVWRLLGPGATTGKGTIPMTGLDRQALVEDRLVLVVFAVDRADPVGEVRLLLPR